MFKPLAQSIAHAATRSKRRGCIVVVLAAILLPPPTAMAGLEAAGAFLPLRFEAAELEVDGRSLHDVRLAVSEAGEFSFESGQLRGTDGGILLDPLVLEGRIDELRLGDGGLEALGLARYEELDAGWSLDSGEDSVTVCLQPEARPLGAFLARKNLSAMTGWIREGRVDACVRYEQPPGGEDALDLELNLGEVSFDSPDGRFAAEALALDIEGRLLFDEPLALDIRGTVRGGEILLDNFYSNFTTAPLEFVLSPEFDDHGLARATIELMDDGALQVSARLKPDKGEQAWRIDVDRLRLDFPGAYRRYLEPSAAAWTLDGLQVTGTVEWQGSLAAGEIESGDLEISDLSVVDTALNRFALTGLNTSLRPGDYRRDSKLGWQGLLLGRINLGAGEALLDSEPGAFALLEPLGLDVLGGRLELGRLRYALPGSPSASAGRSRFELEASLSDIDMEQLTAAFDWPRFSGRLSGEIPGVRFENGVLDVDGEIAVHVFDGAITVRELAAERVFGVLPSLSADIELNDLDLEQVTETFEFGRIGGRVDGHVSDLRMLDWSPVSFDAWAGTPERQGKSSEISRQAVNHLTSIGGGGATVALTGPLMRMFNNFSYKRLGLGCRLANNVCVIRGLEDDGQGVLILEGAGIPKITVRAFNRSIDWPQMVANLGAISSGESVTIGEPQ
mgnify:FL=1